MPRKKPNLIGQRFERLTVISEAGRNKHNHLLWLCKCDCGGEKVVVTSSLKNEQTKSCGCLSRETLSSRATHGLKRTRIYRIWTNMKTRCYNENYTQYADYGGRGITVCDRWQTFENFRDDMLESYEDHVSEFGESETTIDRINVNGNYEPDNCRWATRSEQNGNQRKRRSA